MTDAAGRSGTISTAFNADGDTNQDVVTYHNGQRTIKVNYSRLGIVLADGESLQTSRYLFPELDVSSDTQFNPFVIASVQLADQTSYTMK